MPTFSVKRKLLLPLMILAVTCSLWAVQDSFVGEWKLNPSKSQFMDVMKIKSLGGNKYEFDFGGGPEPVLVDGTDQPGVQGTLLSVSVEGPDSWKVLRKKDGRTLLTAKWELSADGKTLTDNYTEFGENGTPSTTNYLYKRTAAGTGFAGTWESSMPVDGAFVLKIQRYEGNGLSFIRSAEDTRNFTFDGKDHPNAGRGIAEGSTSSARRVDERTLEIIDKVKGKTVRMDEIKLSPDLKTVTRTVRPIGQQEPNVYVFERP